MANAETIGTGFIIAIVFILSVAILSLLSALLTFGCVLLYRKVSRKGIHCNENDLGTKLEPATEEEIKEIEEQIKELDKGKEEPPLAK